jgi:hypothetical protein
MKAKKPVRTKSIKIYLSPEEEKVLRHYSGRTTCRSLSEYSRAVLLRGPVTVLFRNASADDFLEEMVLLKKELNAIGNNFNQAIHRLYLLDQVPEIKTWLLASEIHRAAFLKKTEDILLKAQQIHQLWLQK